MTRFETFAVAGMPMVMPGDDLPALILQTLATAGEQLIDGDVVCVAQKIVSKAENQLVPLASVTPSVAALKLAQQTDKDPRLVELVLQESDEVLRHKLGVLIVRHRLGIVGANAGIDQSNVDHGDGEVALLLPKDPDASAARIRRALETACNVRLGVLITDSHNRPWRMGTVGSAIGCAGLNVLDDHRGGEDMYGRELKVTLINRADALASAATLVMGETTEAKPLAIVRGLPFDDPQQSARDIVRPLADDLFR
ncbi:MAG: coenzyme F420-0:L-glutamate ligase [Pseudomonadales bacterium]